MGTHPIFESDFDCLTEKPMNRLLARPVVQALSRRTMLSSGKTGGHGWYREGYTMFASHPAMYRYIGLAMLVGTPMPFMILTQCAIVFAIAGHWIGRCLAFNSMNM